MACLLDKPFEKKSSDLMMMYLFVRIAEILLRFFVERLLAAE